MWGASAGGHLVAMLGTSGGVKELEGALGPHTDQKSGVRCVIDFFGPTDLLAMSKFPSTMDHDAPDSPESRLVGGPIQEMKDVARTENPITYVTKNDAPFLIMHGSRDPLVPFNQSEILHAALKKAGVASTLIKVEGAGHGFGGPEVDSRVRAFLSTHLLGKEVPLSDGTIQPGRPGRRAR